LRAKSGSGNRNLPDITIVHVRGDIGHFDTVKRVLRKPTIHDGGLADRKEQGTDQFREAIIIPPPSTDGDPQAADTFIVNMMLMMRQIHAERNMEPLHIVAENALDATAKVAMVPTDDGDHGHPVVPDFVNTEAIKARVLCQGLAFPQMNDILQDIFDREDGSITLLMVDVCVVAPDARNTRFSFKEVKQRVRDLLPPRAECDNNSDDLCLGYLTTKEGLQLPPEKLDSPQQFELHDELVILTRKAQTSEEYERLVREARQLAGEEGGECSSVPREARTAERAPDATLPSASAFDEVKRGIQHNNSAQVVPVASVRD
jgi:hypothetical protein